MGNRSLIRYEQLRRRGDPSVQEDDARFAEGRYFDATCLATDNVNDFVYVTGNVGGVPTVSKSNPLVPASMPATGVIVAKYAPTSCLVQVFGLTDTIAGLSAGTRYYLGLNSQVTDTKPASPAITQGVGVGLDGDKLLLALGGDFGQDGLKMAAPSAEQVFSAPAYTCVLRTHFENPVPIEYLVLNFIDAGDVVLSAGPIQELTPADYGRKLTIHNVSTKTVTFNSGGTTYLSGGVDLALPANGLVSFVWSFVGGGAGHWIQTTPAIAVS